MGYVIDNVYYQDATSVGTIFQKCSDNKIDLPCFCYHESLSIAGNCRMCLVETSNSLKLVVSCAMPIVDDIKIYTNNNRVKKARESVLEFLLINHPLDCPICDQGGECDLQDITLVFGSDKSRFYEYTKRAIFDRDCGPLIKMLMTRCIHCTRCVRFLSEIASTSDFGMLGRGESSEIGTYIKHSLVDEISGNIIDLCPVGALTSKPYSFKARPWELSSLESIDVLDSMASNIRVDFFNNKVYRVIPIYDKNVNEDWLTNKARFSYDSNNYQRMNYPMFRLHNNKYVQITWRKSIYAYFYNINKYLFNSIFSFFGSFNDLNLVKSMSEFFNLLGTEVVLINSINSDFRDQYLMDSIINVFENTNNILFFGLNIRLELPILNSKLRKYINNFGKRIKVFFIGISNSYHNVPIISLGNSILDYTNVIKGRSFFGLNILFKSIFASIFIKKFASVKVFINYNIHNASVLKYNFEKFYNKYLNVKVNILSKSISTYNILENNNYKSSVYNDDNGRNLYIFENVDDPYLLSTLNVTDSDFVIYHGQFIGSFSQNANLLIPSFTIYEYNGTFVNIEGRLRKLTKVVSSNNIISSADFFTILKLCYFNYVKTNLSFLRKFSNIIKFFDFLIVNWNIDEDYYVKGRLNKKLMIHIKENNDVMYNYKILLLNSTVVNYYKSDNYSLNSKNMHLASLDYLVRLKTFV